MTSPACTPRADLDRALSLDLPALLAAARKRRDEADAHIRLLLAYGLEFDTAPRRLSLTRMARISGKSRGTLRAGRAYTPGDVARLSALLGRSPRAKEGG